MNSPHTHFIAYRLHKRVLCKTNKEICKYLHIRAFALKTKAKVNHMPTYLHELGNWTSSMDKLTNFGRVNLITKSELAQTHI